ncbi:protocatechuate 3,4-dioxygenase subunit alpha [Cupriavidus sp. CER94]|uniref:protocatechuate 3,4-dioxygenase subunit alpha n=1 Tax=Cupriavidus sp. CER94 TaxID=3377036 RepID=UPI00380D0A19
MLYATASQTVGPYLHIGLTGLNCADLTADAPDLAAQRIVIEGRVVDGRGEPVPDGMAEIWQANPAGRYRHPEDARELPLVPGFTGFGRVPTEADGSFRFTTVKPGTVPDGNGRPQAPHIMVSVFTRGLVKHVATRLYFPEDTAAHGADAVLSRVPADRRDTLIARAEGQNRYRWDVVLQGPGETVFFDI